MKNKFFLIFFIFSVFSKQVLSQQQGSQLIFSRKYDENLKKMSEIKSNLIFIDSTKLLHTFSVDKGIKDFIKSYYDSSISFVSNFKFDLINNNLILQKNRFNINLFETAFYNYVKNNFTDLKFKEKRKTNTKYRIITDWMFYSAEKQIVITIMDFTKNQHVILFTAKIPFEEMELSEISFSSKF